MNLSPVEAVPLDTKITLTTSGHDHASLEEHDLDRFVEGEVTEPEDELARAKAKKGLGKSKGDDEACVDILTHLGPRNSLV